MEEVVEYIAQQESHDPVVSFQEECRELLDAHGIADDERYVWGGNEVRYRFLFPVWKEYLTPFPCPRASAPAYAAAIFTLAMIESSRLQPLPGDDKQDIQIAIFVPY